MKIRNLCLIQSLFLLLSVLEVCLSFNQPLPWKIQRHPVSFKAIHRSTHVSENFKLRQSNKWFHNQALWSSTTQDNNFVEVEKDEDNSVLIATDHHLSNPQLLFNAILLVSAFGYAFYTILNIDHEITRGWTHAEIMMRVPMDTWKGYEDSLSEKPIFTKTMINVIIYLLGDWLSQTLFQKKNVLDFDAARTLRNGFIGACFGPLVHQYYEFSDAILPVEEGINRLYKIVMDQSLYLTAKVSLYLLAVGLLAGDSWEDSVQNVKDKIKPITFTAWKFWPLVHCITYTVIPAQHRILWVNCVDLVWNAILALMAEKKGEEEEGELIETASEMNGFENFVRNDTIGLERTVTVLDDTIGLESAVTILDDTNGLENTVAVLDDTNASFDLLGMKDILDDGSALISSLSPATNGTDTVAVQGVSI